MFEIDLTPIIEMVAAVVTPILSVLAMWLVTSLAKKAGLDIEAKHREALDGAIAYGIDNAVAWAVQRGKTRAHIATDNELLAGVVNYVATSVPDALRKFGVTEARLKEMIIARLGYDMEMDATQATP